MLTLKEHATAAIEEYWKVNQIDYNSEGIQEVWTEEGNKVRHGFYVAPVDPTRLYYVIQRDDFDPPKTDLTVYMQANRLVF